MLDALLQGLDRTTRFVLTMDARMPVPISLPDNVQIKRVKPTVVQRLRAEVWLAHSVAPEDVVLCFGNLPPLFRLKGYTRVFVQNRYLIDDVKLDRFSFEVRLRLVLERLWLCGRMSNVNEFVVQTPTMKRLLDKKIQVKVPVRVFPFVAEPEGYARTTSRAKHLAERKYDFAYIASGEPHKNHRRLLEAWCLLAGEGLFPSLCLTLDEAGFAGLCGEIEAMRQRYGLNVENVGVLPHREVLELYKNVSAAIYPSTFESFGLPLIEAHQAGLPILASELDYVRDVLDPEQTFDPESPVSIARAVKRFMGMREEVLPLLDAKAFLEKCIGKAE